MMPLNGPHNANLARLLLNHIHTGHHTSNVRQRHTNIHGGAKFIQLIAVALVSYLVLDTCPSHGSRGHARRSDWEWAEPFYRWTLCRWEDLELVSFTPVHFWSIQHNTTNQLTPACRNSCYWFPLNPWFILFTSILRWHSFRSLCDYNKRICLGKRSHFVATACRESMQWLLCCLMKKKVDPILFVHLKLLKLDQTCRQML